MSDYRKLRSFVRNGARRHATRPGVGTARRRRIVRERWAEVNIPDDRGERPRQRLARTWPSVEIPPEEVGAA